MQNSSTYLRTGSRLVLLLTLVAAMIFPGGLLQANAQPVGKFTVYTGATQLGTYDTFSQAIEAVNQGQAADPYQIKVNADVTLENVAHKISGRTVEITSEGGKFTLSQPQANLRHFEAADGANVTLSNIVLDGGKTGGGIDVETASQLTVNDATIQNTKSKGAAGAIGVWEGTATINAGALITGAEVELVESPKRSGHGGAINVSSKGVLNITGGTIEKNTARFGGAISSYGTINITGGKFIDNTSPYVGGAIYSKNAKKLNISGANFKTNHAAGWGSAVFAIRDDANTGEVTISNTSFEGHTTEALGGAIFVEGLALSVANSTFTGNEAVKTTQVPVPSDPVFPTNAPVGTGGAIFFQSNNADLIIKDSTFTNNKAEQAGGGLYVRAAKNVTITNSKFVDNKTNYPTSQANAASTNDSSGGAISTAKLPNIKMVISGSTFASNKSAYGGAIYAQVDTDITGSTFISNAAHGVLAESMWGSSAYGGFGGAIYLTNNRNYTVDSSTFTGSTAYFSGGAVSVNAGSKLSVKNNTSFVDNSITLGQGGAIYVSDHTYIQGNPLPTDIPANSYPNLATDNTTVFKANKAGELYEAPPSRTNLTHLQAKETSFSSQGTDSPLNHVLNNYDVCFVNLRGYTIPVTKTWIDNDGNPLTPPVDSIKVDMYYIYQSGQDYVDQKPKPEPMPADAIKWRTVELTKANGWKSYVRLNIETKMSQANVSNQYGTFQMQVPVPPTYYLFEHSEDPNDSEMETTLAGKKHRIVWGGDLLHSVDITNRQVPQVDLPVAKTISAPEGVAGPDIAGKYTYTIADDPSDSVDSPLPAVTSINGPGVDGESTAFAGIQFVKPGTYKYTITESGGVPGVVDGERVKTVTVNVSGDFNQPLNIEVVGADSTPGNVVASTTFTGELKPVSSNPSSELFIRKVIAGRDLVAGEFNFTLTPQNGAPGSVQTATNDANGIVKFDPIVFGKVGEFEYELVEVAGSDGNIQYDQTKHTIVATVSTDLQDQTKLVVSWKVKGMQSSITFLNRFIVISDPQTPKAPSAPAATKPAKLPKTGC